VQARAFGGQLKKCAGQCVTGESTAGGGHADPAPWLLSRSGGRALMKQGPQSPR
jgi:hypothetical protein